MDLGLNSIIAKTSARLSNEGKTGATADELLSTDLKVVEASTDASSSAIALAPDSPEHLTKAAESAHVEARSNGDIVSMASKVNAEKSGYHAADDDSLTKPETSTKEGATEDNKIEGNLADWKFSRQLSILCAYDLLLLLHNYTITTATPVALLPTYITV